MLREEKNENFKSKFFYDRTCMAGVKDMGDLYYDCKDAETWNCSSGQAYWKYIELYDVTGKNNKIILWFKTKIVSILKSC